MASSTIQPWSNQGCRPSLSEINAVVSARLGPTRVAGNAQPACFNRQVAIYLAARVGGWSTTAIGEFYNGRDHSTVCYGIQRIESLRENDPEVDALISELKGKLDSSSEQAVANVRAFRPPTTLRKSMLSESDVERIADLVAAKVCLLLGSKSV
jgi:hypothetical protein